MTNKIITIDPELVSGAPVFTGTLHENLAG